MLVRLLGTVLAIVLGAVLLGVTVIQFELLSPTQILSLPLMMQKYHRNYFNPNSKPAKVEWKSPSTKRQRKFPREFEISEKRYSAPNILLIVADDLGYNDVSGGFGIATPNIDALRTGGVHFRRAYAGQGTCAPSRAAILTGRFATRFGYEFTPIPKQLSRVLTIHREGDLFWPVLHKANMKDVPHFEQMVVPANETMISNVVQSAGYDTYLLGKWDSGTNVPYTALDRGFNESLCFSQGAASYFHQDHPDLIQAEGSPFDEFLKMVLPFYISHNNGKRMDPDRYMTDYLSKEAAELIHHRSNFDAQAQNPEDKAVPFFITLTYNAPHSPFQAMRSDYEAPEVQALPSHQHKVYGAMLRSLDRGVGTVVQALRDTDQLNNTLIIFTSDNGGSSFAALENINKPFRGWKGSLFEGGLRVPMYFHWPAFASGKEGAQLTEDVPVAHVDLFASLAAVVTGDQYVSAAPLDGLNLFSLVAQRIQRQSGLSSEFAMQSSNSEDGMTCREGINQKGSDSSKEIIEGQCFEDTSAWKEELPLAALHQIQNRTLYWRSGHYSALRRSHWKVSKALRPNKVWFFHLGVDPTEQVNLAPLLGITTLESLSHFMQDWETGATTIFADNTEEEFVHILGFRFKKSYLYRELHLTVIALKSVDDAQSAPLWASLSETPVTIDKIHKAQQHPDDEHVYWCN